MKAHIGVGAESGPVHTVRGITGSVRDVVQANAPLHGEEVKAWGDAGYQGTDKRPAAAEGVRWSIGMRPGKRRQLDNSRLVEHPFCLLKRQFGHVKVRCCGLVEQTPQLHALFALSNLWMARRTLMAR